MPYIKQNERTQFAAMLDARPMLAHSPGHLNYAITKIVHGFLEESARVRTGQLDVSPNYEEFNTAIGVLECAKLELYRRIVAPYEDIKIRENGDVAA